MTTKTTTTKNFNDMSNTETFYCEDCGREIPLTEESIESRICDHCYDNNSICDRCGGNMHWCHCCRVWSSTCCIEYGTCQCN